MNIPLREWLGLAGFIVICFAAAGIGGAFTGPAIGGWYALLKKPAFNPPNWIFGPVWTVLYLSMALAAWLIWKRQGFAGAMLPFTFFFIQLALNCLWSIIFFGLHNPGLACADIILLWSAIAATLLLFYRISPAAGGLLIPYLAWVSYAALLNFALWRMNLEV
jgi:tryptophan-rich sensory protein